MDVLRRDYGRGTHGQAGTHQCRPIKAEKIQFEFEGALPSLYGNYSKLLEAWSFTSLLRTLDLGRDDYADAPPII